MLTVRETAGGHEANCINKLKLLKNRALRAKGSPRPSISAFPTLTMEIGRRLTFIPPEDSAHRDLVDC